ncbi:MAG: hypothetical protein ACLR1T_02570 [Evtepia gabavorous]
MPRSSTRPRPISWATFTKGFMAPCSPWSTCGRGGSPTTPTSSWRSPPPPAGRGCTGVPKGGIFWPITRDPGKDFPPSTRPFWPMPGTTG